MTQHLLALFRLYNAAMSEDLARAFVSFLAIIDPIGNVLVFYVLTRALSFPRQLQVAAIAVLAAAAMLILFSLWGREVLDLLDISQGSFKVAAGSLLLLSAYQLVVHGQSMVISEEHGGEPVEIALVPFATPLLAGPGALATATSFSETVGPGTTILAMSLVLALAFFAFAGASLLFVRLGASALRLLSRLVGILLFAIATDFILEGLSTSFPGLLTN